MGTLSKEYQKNYNLYSIAGDKKARRILKLLQKKDYTRLGLQEMTGYPVSVIYRKIETLIRVGAISKSKTQVNHDGRKEDVFRANLIEMEITTQFIGHDSAQSEVLI